MKAKMENNVSFQEKVHFNVYERYFNLFFNFRKTLLAIIFLLSCHVKCNYKWDNLKTLCHNITTLKNELKNNQTVLSAQRKLLRFLNIKIQEGRDAFEHYRLINYETARTKYINFDKLLSVKSRFLSELRKTIVTSKKIKKIIQDLKNLEYKVTKYHYFNNFWAHKITFGVKFKDLNEFMFTDIQDFDENLLDTIEVGVDVCGIE